MRENQSIKQVVDGFIRKLAGLSTTETERGFHTLIDELSKDLSTLQCRINRIKMNRPILIDKNYLNKTFGGKNHGKAKTKDVHKGSKNVDSGKRW